MTVEEIKTESGKDSVLLKGILTTFKPDFLTGMEAEGMIIRTKEQDAQHLEAHVKEILPGKVEEKFKLKFKESLDAIDEEVKTLTNAEKGPHEKTTEFLKRAIKEFNAKGGDPITKEKVKELEKMLSDTKKDLELKLAAKEKELFDSKIEWDVNNYLDKVNIATPVHLKTDQEKQAYVGEQKQLIKNGFLQKFQPKKDEAGNIVFYEGDKPQMSSKDGKPKGAGELIGEKYSGWFLPATQQRTGSGTGSGEANQGSQNGSFKDKEAIHEYLKLHEIPVGTQAYYNEFEKIAKENKITV